MAGPLSDDVSVFDGGGPTSDYSSTNLGYQPSERTGNEVATQIRRLFGDQSGAQLEDADFLVWINDAQDTISNINRPLKAHFRLDSIKGVRTYSFPNTDIQQLESLHYGGALLDNLSYATAEELGYVGDEQSGTPIVWWEFGGKFSFYPRPDVSKRIDVRYSMRPQRLRSLGDLLGVPDKYYQAVLAYCMQQAYELDENPALLQIKERQFRETIADFGEEERTAQNMLYETVTIVPDPYS